MLGDSEPIGSHVDPYDPTSPVRISPEELGGEKEVLAEEAPFIRGPITEDVEGVALYVEAKSGAGLEHVGGKAYRQRMEELEAVDLYTKLTGKEFGNFVP